MRRLVWDPFIRTFHWSLVFAFFFAYLLDGDYPTFHSLAGYTVLLLIGFRLAWGFIGPRHAKFSDFLVSPQSTLQYFRSAIQRKGPHYQGHDPGGGVMIIFLLLTLTGTGLTGAILFGMEGSGPFADTVFSNLEGQKIEGRHGLLANLCLGLILVHLAGVLLMSWVSKENLIKSMIDGRKNDK